MVLGARIRLDPVSLQFDGRDGEEPSTSASKTSENAHSKVANLCKSAFRKWRFGTINPRGTRLRHLVRLTQTQP